LPYELIIKQAKLLFMHSIENNYALSSFTGIWNKNIAIQGDRPLRNADNYTVPNPRTELFKNPRSIPSPSNGITWMRTGTLETILLLKLP
jgi:hypothetical protein